MKAIIISLSLILCVLIYLYIAHSADHFIDARTSANLQDRSNPLSGQTNPAKNPAVPIGIAASLTPDIRSMSMVALNSYDQTITPDGGILNAMPGSYTEGYSTFSTTATSVPISDENSMLGIEKYCRDHATGPNPFSDPKFAENCGVCTTAGKYSDGKAMSANGGGVLIYNADKKLAYKRQANNGFRYPRALPSLGRATCPGSTNATDDSAPPTLAIDGKTYTDILNRKKCQLRSDFGAVTAGKCGQCVENPKVWSYIKDPPGGDINTVKLILVGSGLVTVTSNGQQVLTNDGTGKPILDVALSTQQPLTIDLGNYLVGGKPRGYIKEGEQFVISVKGNGVGTVAYVGGLIQSLDPSNGIYVEELYNTIRSDSANSGNKPKLGQPQLAVDTLGLIVKRVVPTMPLPSGPEQMILMCEMPLTFINSLHDAANGTSQIAYYDCASGPFVTSAENAKMLGEDECTDQRPGAYTDTCVRSRILSAGCSTGGSWYKAGTSIGALGLKKNMSIAKFSAWIKSQLRENPLTTATNLGCYGVDTSSPCDGLTPGSAPSVACLKNLYSNASERNPLQGRAYTTNK